MMHSMSRRICELFRSYPIASIVIFFFIVRLIGITHPPIEPNHHWRQVTGLMVARNYHEHQMDLLRPQIDEVGVGTEVSSGIIGMEFPLLNALHALAANIFGYEHWYGRLIVLILSSFGIWWFSRILDRFFTQRVVVMASLLLTCSVWFSFSRKMMPDVVAISLAFASFLSLLHFFEKRKSIHLLLYTVCACLALLVKVSSGVILALIPAFLFWKRADLRYVIVVFIASLIPLTACVYWYGIHNVALSQESGMWYNTGEGLDQGFQSIIVHLRNVLHFFYFETMMGYGASILGLIFIIECLIKGPRLFGIATGVLLFTFFLYAVYSGRHFATQHYYMIPMAPVYATALALGLEKWKRHSWKWGLIALVCVECLLNQQHDFRLKKSECYKLELESHMNSLAERSDLVVINGEGNPQELYFSHHKGWTTTSEELKNLEYLNKLQEAGARWLIVNKHRTNIRSYFPISFENEHYTIYSMAY